MAPVDCVTSLLLKLRCLGKKKMFNGYYLFKSIKIIRPAV